MKIDEIVDNALYMIYITADHNHATVDLWYLPEKFFKANIFFVYG